MKTFFATILIFLSTLSFAQQHKLEGNLLGKDGNPLLYATAVLLYPGDSTMAYYGITNEDGHFVIKNIKEGNYLLQTSYLGYKPHYQHLSVPLPKGNTLAAIIMEPLDVSLPELEVSADRIPFIIKDDTIEYGAGSYKVKSDAAAEDLLKKLPGIQVDRAGNIKAQGENVQNVLVDGKEFFSSDPKVATKNLPADAVDKVQVYDKKSEETELTGIEDGNYAKTINFILKDGKKSAVFGDVSAGIGTNEKFQGGAKLYRFTKKYQLAALAMINNVNKYGFSFNDYLDFNGGLQNLLHGGNGSITIGSSDDIPINFGQSINGLVSSGVGGANYTYEARKNNRFNVSYLISGSDKKLTQNTLTQNYLDSLTFLKEDDFIQNSSNRTHRLNFGWKNRIDSSQNLVISGGLGYVTYNANSLLNSQSIENKMIINNLEKIAKNGETKYSAKFSSTYLKKWRSNWKLFKLGANFSMNNDMLNKNWANKTIIMNPPDSIFDKAYQNNDNMTLRYSMTSSITRKIKPLWYLVPSISIGKVNEKINRIQGEPPVNDNIIDSLSPDFIQDYYYLRTALSLNRNTKKSQFNLSLGVENTSLTKKLNNNNSINSNSWYFTPKISWNYEYRTAKRIGLSLRSSVITPTANQSLPTANTSNPLMLYSGNINLKPEYSNDLQINWMYFDQFSQISLFAYANANYTLNKINYSRNIMPDLSQQLSLVNVKDDYRASASFEFNTPIKALSLDFNASLREDWNRGINVVNDVENTIINFSHSLTVKFNNRKKEKWDIGIGATFQLQDAKYSIQNSLNKVYYNFTGFMDLSYTPNDKWYFSFTSDLKRYNSNSFGETVYIPLLRAEINRYILKNNRGVITFEIFDILDKNNGIERISEMNYLQQTISNTLQRYAMITFKYRLNSMAKKSGFQLDMKRR